MPGQDKLMWEYSSFHYQLDGQARTFNVHLISWLSMFAMVTHSTLWGLWCWRINTYSQLMSDRERMKPQARGVLHPALPTYITLLVSQGSKHWCSISHRISTYSSSSLRTPPPNLNMNKLITLAVLLSGEKYFQNNLLFRKTSQTQLQYSTMPQICVFNSYLLL